ncbi:hypothetical protein NBRC116592_06510 [Colwellia sp. KU-HH00111]|uniref:OmpA family protein n=1 Tax=Colwellia sp. KU-HH00111 TaxID=3127652 RepID=UPI00310332E1
MPKKTSSDDVKTDPQIAQVRTLILGKDSQHVTASIEKQARNMVADVLTEALHDRQKRDRSVNKVLRPIIEDAVQQSVTHSSERLVSSLYPLVGSLVRKSVSAFLTNFMEKTNQLLENSLTIKGLTWRIKARQAGVSFAQYAASQIFIYRVEHVFLIHRETGLLLNSVNLDKHDNSDAELISSMLSAINDFVGDSFSTNQDGLKEQLQSVSTDNFNLLIKAGPSALVVAAVIGQPPQQVKDQLQQTLEDIHSLYFEELNHFDGNNLIFENTSTLLEQCLLAEQKTLATHKKKPWFAWLLLLFVIIFSTYQTLHWFENSQLAEKIMQIDLQPGIVVKQLKVTNNNVMLDIMRDPDAIAIENWLETTHLSNRKLNITERHYYSLAPELIVARAKKILTQYPKVSSRWDKNTLTLSGALPLSELEQLINQLSSSGFSGSKNLNTEQLQTTSSEPITHTKAFKRQLFNDLIGRISAIQLDFTIASEEITAKMQLTLQRLYQQLQQLDQVAKALNISFGLVIIGTSDSSGNKSANQQLSMKRANNAAQALQAMGLSKDNIYVSGLGQIDISGLNNTSRKVMFNVLFIDKDTSAPN